MVGQCTNANPYYQIVYLIPFISSSTQVLEQKLQRLIWQNIKHETQESTAQ